MSDGPANDKNAGNDVAKEEPTEASPEVLAELSRLFGPERDVVVIDEPSGDTLTEVVNVAGMTAPTAAVEPEDGSGAVQVVPAGTSPTESGQLLQFRSGPGTRSVTGLTGDGPPPADPGLDPLIVIDMEPDVPAAATDVDPRFEERRRAWARRDRLKRVRWLKIAALLAACAVVVLAVMASPIFAIRTFTVEGNVYTAPASIAEVRRILKGSSVFTADTTRARKVLLKDPWVADVRITTNFPASAVVEISERVPVVWFVGTDGKARMVDARGKVIAVLTGYPTKYLQVKGTGPDVGAGETADDAYRAAAQLVLALPDELRPRVTALDLSPAGELSMVLKGDTLVRFGTPTDLQDKLVAVVVLLRRQDPRTIAVIDVSAGEPTVLGR